MDKTIEGGVKCFADLCNYSLEENVIFEGFDKNRIPFRLLKITLFLELDENAYLGEELDIDLSIIAKRAIGPYVNYYDEEKKNVKIVGYDAISDEKKYWYVRRYFVYLYMLCDWPKRDEFLWMFFLLPCIYKLEKSGVSGKLILENLKQEYSIARLDEWLEQVRNVEKEEVKQRAKTILNEAAAYIKEKYELSEFETKEKYRITEDEEYVADDFYICLKRIAPRIRQEK